LTTAKICNKRRTWKNIRRERSPIQIYTLRLREPLKVTVEYTRHWFFYLQN